MWVHILRRTALVDQLIYMQRVILHVGSYRTGHNPSRSSRIHASSYFTCELISNKILQFFYSYKSHDLISFPLFHIKWLIIYL